MATNLRFLPAVNDLIEVNDLIDSYKKFPEKVSDLIENWEKEQELRIIYLMPFTEVSARLLAQDIVSVEPLQEPISHIHYLDHIYIRNIENE